MESRRTIPCEDRNADGPDLAAWNLTPADCPLLSVHGIARVGIDDTAEGYERVRTRPGGSFITETESGEGRILLEGKWQRITRGDVTMAPPRVLNAFYTPAGRRWKLAYVRYDEPPGTRPLIGSSSPLRLSRHSRLARAIGGLREEWDNEREPAMLRHWLALIDALVRRLAQPWKQDDRLSALWEQVGAQPDGQWTLTRLARLSGLSSEHLRRLCLKTLGRTPMEQLTCIRVQRALELLESTGDKIDVIARNVGYANGHAFSRAFQRSVGMKPSEFRARL